MTENELIRASLDMSLFLAKDLKY